MCNNVHVVKYEICAINTDNIIIYAKNVPYKRDIGKQGFVQQSIWSKKILENPPRKSWDKRDIPGIISRPLLLGLVDLPLLHYFLSSVTEVDTRCCFVRQSLTYDLRNTV